MKRKLSSSNIKSLLYNVQAESDFNCASPETVGNTLFVPLNQVMIFTLMPLISKSVWEVAKRFKLYNLKPMHLVGSEWKVTNHPVCFLLIKHWGYLCLFLSKMMNALFSLRLLVFIIIKDRSCSTVVHLQTVLKMLSAPSSASSLMINLITEGQHRQEDTHQQHQANAMSS